MPDPGRSEVSTTIASFKGLCPRCGAQTLFAGLLRIAPKCAVCNLDFTTFNVGDGATAFGTLAIGTLVVVGAITLQMTIAPPFWVQALIWVPVTTLAVIGLLRVANAALLGSEYRHAAREGRIQH